MEKQIYIGGKEVALKTTGATLLRYKIQFGKDLLIELMKLEKCYDGQSFNPEQLDIELFYNITWLMAKTADSSLKPPVEWLDEFDSFPVLEILPEVMEMLAALMRTSPKK